MTSSLIKHKFRNHEISPATRCLIVGTFNPDTPKNSADFFYGTGRNDLWRLLPAAFGMEGHLKGRDRNPERMRFMQERGIDFIDIISEVMVDADRAHHRKDSYIGGRVSVWQDVFRQMDKLPNLERVCFTRKTFKAFLESRIRSKRLLGIATETMRGTRKSFSGALLDLHA